MRDLIVIDGIAGVDEAGRGPLAGPVAAAAVVLDPARIPPGLDDSKALGESARDRLFDVIVAEARAVAVVFASAAEIDRTDVRAATLSAMAGAVRALAVVPRGVVVDGRDVPPGLGVPSRAIVGGDALHPAIMAASIIAKVARDRAMIAIAARHPGYGFERHKGYGTAEHRAALARLGPCPIHRMTFRPIAQGRLV